VLRFSSTNLFQNTAWGCLKREALRLFRWKTGISLGEGWKNLHEFNQNSCYSTNIWVIELVDDLRRSCLRRMRNVSRIFNAKIEKKRPFCVRRRAVERR
jgi:hypothetical protein